MHRHHYLYNVNITYAGVATQTYKKVHDGQYV